MFWGANACDLFYFCYPWVLFVRPRGPSQTPIYTSFMGNGQSALQQRTNPSRLHATGKVWLVILDDIWEASHGRQLNFIDPVQSPEARVFATSRFAKLMPGYVVCEIRVCMEIWSL